MQGKRPGQVKDSARSVAYGIIGAIACMIIATIWPAPLMEDATTDPTYNYWTPTAEDEMYLDSLHMIVNETKTNVDTISKMVDRCIEKLDQMNE